MLMLKPNCECCDLDLPPDSADARICSYECTFCADCVGAVLGGICPNCGGGFMPRPVRAAQMLRRHPASADRVTGTHPACAAARHAPIQEDRP